MKRKKYIALVPAAGKGSRMKSKEEKLSIKIGSYPILVHTLKNLDETAVLDKIILVVAPARINQWKKELSKYSFKTTISLVAGGRRRQDSVLNGFKKVPKDIYIVLIHDGARPFVTGKDLKTGIKFSEKYGVAIPVTRVKPTIKEVDSKNFVRRTFNRKSLRAVQTPQCFKYDILKKCLENNKKDVTDEATLAEYLGYKVKTFKGFDKNIKITTKEDLLLAEKLLSKR
jgi:2-C-methyl-D-erythritol 4-phosphate cytidylyltransferase